jgi:hypothetical protein
MSASDGRHDRGGNATDHGSNHDKDLETARRASYKSVILRQTLVFRL